jgi:hypothetical protein
MQADVRIAVSASTRIGFAGPQVILNTMCEQDQERFDKECPPDFQSATYVAAYGQLDMVMENATPASIAQVVGEVASLLTTRGSAVISPELSQDFAPTEVDMNAPFNYTRSRSIVRPQVRQSFLLFLARSDFSRLKISLAMSSKTLWSCMAMGKSVVINVFVVVWHRSVSLPTRPLWGVL